MRRKKVLIICGGGIFGAIPAHFLSMVPYEDMNRLDLISGCSIGGILASAYCVGRSFKEIDKVFQERADECFDKRWQAYLNPLASPKYKNESLDKVIFSMIGSAKVKDIRGYFPNLDYVVPSLDFTNDNYKVWDNITGKDDEMSLTSIAGFTSAAPSYYSGRDWNGKCMIDGGLIEVAPLLTATTALKGKRKVPFIDMDVLMIGTGVEIKDDYKKVTTKQYNDLSLLGIATDVLVPYATLSNEMATRYWGANIGYHSFNYFNPCTIKGDLDDTSQVSNLVAQCDVWDEDFIYAWKKFMED